MIIQMKPDATQEQVKAVRDLAAGADCRSYVSYPSGSAQIAIGGKRGAVSSESVKALPGVGKVFDALEAEIPSYAEPAVKD